MDYAFVYSTLSKREVTFIIITYTWKSFSSSYQLFMHLEYSPYSSFSEARILLVQNTIQEKLVKQAYLLSSPDEVRIIVALYRIYSGISTNGESWCALGLPTGLATCHRTLEL